MNTTRGNKSEFIKYNAVKLITLIFLIVFQFTYIGLIYEEKGCDNTYYQLVLNEKKYDDNISLLVKSNNIQSSFLFENEDLEIINKFNSNYIILFLGNLGLIGFIIFLLLKEKNNKYKMAFENRKLLKKIKNYELSIENAKLGMFIWDLDSGMINFKTKKLNFGMNESDENDLIKIISESDLNMDEKNVLMQYKTIVKSGAKFIELDLPVRENGIITKMNRISLTCNIDNCCIGIIKDISSIYFMNQKKSIDKIIEKRFFSLVEVNLSKNKVISCTSEWLSNFAISKNNDYYEVLNGIVELTSFIENKNKVCALLENNNLVEAFHNNDYNGYTNLLINDDNKNCKKVYVNYILYNDILTDDICVNVIVQDAYLYNLGEVDFQTSLNSYKYFKRCVSNNILKNKNKNNYALLLCTFKQDINKPIGLKIFTAIGQLIKNIFKGGIVANNDDNLIYIYCEENKKSVVIDNVVKMIKIIESKLPIIVGVGVYHGCDNEDYDEILNKSEKSMCLAKLNGEKHYSVF